MGFRFRKRLNIFKGLGLNLTGRGIGASIRNRFGSVNSRGRYTIRTGIPGLTWHGNFGKGVKSFLAKFNIKF